jgi:hypothetical protein
MKTWWQASALILGCALVLGACKKDDDAVGPIEGAPPAELVGGWKMQSATVNDQPGDLAQVLDWAANTVSSEFTVETSGLYTYRELDGQGLPTFLAAGTITVSGNSFTIAVSSINGTPIPTQRQDGTWEFVGGELRLTTEQEVGGAMATVVVVCIKK